MQTITITKKAALGIAAAFAGLFVLGVAGGAWASHSFTDVPDDHTFHDSIGYVADAGIAGGFGDGTYRPGNNVTRGQMAAFMHRASGNAPGIAPSVNAAKLGGKTAADWQVEIDALKNKLAAVTYDAGSKVLTISGANLQIVNGTDSTFAVNGLGNLIVGYNEGLGDTRTGSHNLVVGPLHSYSSYGGLVAGFNNTISGDFASVTGGVENTASGDTASVTGGLYNTASAVQASVTGGTDNTASGQYASVTGGYNNTASGDSATVIGGTGNVASGSFSIAEIDALKNKLQFVSIVDTNTMRISGANLQIVSGSGTTEGTVNGLGNLIVGYDESFSDAKTGSHNVVVGSHHAYSSYGGIVAGANNTISGPYASVTGGIENTASGEAASVTGGTLNRASGTRASVTGGIVNFASGDYTSVTGGRSNTAGGTYSTVSGGTSRSVTGPDDWRAGDYFSEQ